jgi:hypothetical protein
MADEIRVLVDDPSALPNEVVLFRRTSWDKIGGIEKYPVGPCDRLSANFFSDLSYETAQAHGFAEACMSVGASNVLERLNLDASAMLADFAGCGLVAVTAGDLRGLCKHDGSAWPQGLMLAPTDREPWHAVVFDQTQRPRPAAGQKAIARCARVIVPLIKAEF